MLMNEVVCCAAWIECSIGADTAFFITQDLSRFMDQQLAAIVAILKKHLHGYGHTSVNSRDGQTFDVLSSGTTCWRGFLVVLYAPVCDLVAFSPVGA